MNIEAKIIENAIDNLKEAIRADNLITEAAHFYLSKETYNEITENAKKHIAKAFESMKEVPKAGGEKSWYLGCFPPLLIDGCGVPCSLLHLCIHDVAIGRFKRPEPLPEITGDFANFFEEVSDEQKAEYEFLCKFADFWENLKDWRTFDAMP